MKQGSALPCFCPAALPAGAPDAFCVTSRMFFEIKNTVIDCLRNGHHVALGIFRFLIPILLVVKLLEVSGLIPWLSMPMRPMMDMLGLPAEISLAWLPCMLVSIFSGLMVLVSLIPHLPELTIAQMTVFGLLVLIAHSLILEVRIAGQCGV
ncbi:MAG: hypothetical protein J6I40_04950, partial [Mailhella sp.]|nr:hypothetical protein [Mailhella sp.]